MDGRRRRRVTVPDAGVRERILDTAGALFYAEGIQAVGVQRLIAEADVAKASLYAHFPSKDDVITAYLAQRADTWQSVVRREVLDADVPPRARVLLYFDLVARWMHGPDFHGCPFQQAAAEVRDPRHAARTVAAGHRAWLREVLVQLVRDAGARDPEALAGMLQLLIDGAAAAAVIDGPRWQADHARRAAERLLDAATTGRAPRAACGRTRRARR